MKAFHLLFIALSAFIGATDAIASDDFQSTGYIRNDQGEKCWYKQATTTDGKYFHGSLTARMGTITFDNPQCMKDTGIGLDTNKMMINNVVSRWYSHSDADFKTKPNEMFPSSMMQKKGFCIQSGKYPAIGITIDYEVNKSSIVRVRHGSALQGCKK